MRIGLFWYKADLYFHQLFSISPGHCLQFFLLYWAFQTKQVILPVHDARASSRFKQKKQPLRRIQRPHKKETTETGSPTYIRRKLLASVTHRMLINYNCSLLRTRNQLRCSQGIPDKRLRGRGRQKQGYGGDGESRTHMSLSSLGPQPSASAIPPRPHGGFHFTTSGLDCQ